MTFRVLCHREIALPIAAKLPDCEVVAFDRYDEQLISSLISDCDVLVSSLATKKIVENGKCLKFIQCWGVGVNGIDLYSAHKRGIKVSNFAGFNSTAVADYTLSAILLLTTRLNAFDREIKHRSRILSLRVVDRLMGNDAYGFNLDPPFEYSELTGKVLSIIGYGAIGQQIALRANAFGLRILAIKRTPSVEQDLKIEFVGTLENLKSVLEKSDFISVNLPLTEQTRGVIGAEEFAVVKPSAYFINSSRAEVVDNKALLSALKNGLLAGAVLDVVDESLKKAFAQLNNVILTPHISGDSKESVERGIEIAAENIRRLMSGQLLLNVVTLEKPY